MTNQDTYWQDPTSTGETYYDPVNNPRAPGRVEYYENAQGTTGYVGYIDDDGNYIFEDLERSPTTAFGTYLFGLEAKYGMEPLDDYKPGGYHPTHLGDTLGPPEDRNRYTVLHKLGHGSAYAVWLCRDHRALRPKYVALKIMKAEVDREKLMELHLDALEDHAAPGGQYIAFPLNKFVVDGPNGTHQCLVYEVLGHSIDSGMWLEWDSARDNEAPTVLRKMCHQVAQAMSFLHKNGICHGGKFRPANIRVKLRGLEELSEPEILRLFGRPKTVAVRSLPPATNLQHQPNYLVHAHNSGCIPRDPPPATYVSVEIAVTGFGMAFFAASPPARLTGGDFRFQPPEFTLGLTSNDWPANFVGFASDRWALGWTLVCMRTQRQFFQTTSPAVDQDEHLSMVVYFFGFNADRGPFGNDLVQYGEVVRNPPFWWGFWPEGDNRFDDRGAAFHGVFAMFFDADGVQVNLDGMEGGVLEQIFAHPFEIGERKLDIWPAEVEFLGDLAHLLCRYDSPRESRPRKRLLMRFSRFEIQR